MNKVENIKVEKALGKMNVCKIKMHLEKNWFSISDRISTVPVTSPSSRTLLRLVMIMAVTLSVKVFFFPGRLSLLTLLLPFKLC